MRLPSAGSLTLLIPTSLGSLAYGMVDAYAHQHTPPIDNVVICLSVGTLMVGCAAGLSFGNRLAGRRRWRRFVPSLAHGPVEPQGGFLVYRPEKRVHADESGSWLEFAAVPYEWGWPTGSAESGCWSKADWREEGVVDHVQWRWAADAPVEAVASAWFDFCQEVEKLNQQLADAFALEQLAAEERRALAADNRAQAEELAAVLPTPARQ